MKIKITNDSKHNHTAYSTTSSKVMDIRADIEKELLIKPKDRGLVKASLFKEIPIGYDAIIGHRSGLTINKGFNMTNSAGTIEADYRGGHCIILTTLSDRTFIITERE